MLTPIPETKRPAFLPKFFNVTFPQAEQMLFDLASEYFEDYTGGSWDFYEIDTHPLKDETPSFPIMVLSQAENIHVINTMNYFDGHMDPFAASVGLNLILFSRASFALDGETYTPYFLALREWFIDTDELNADQKRLIAQFTD